MRNDLMENGLPVFKSMIRRTSGFGKAALAGQIIKDVNDPRLYSAWEDYVAVGKELLEVLG
jgi:chromosome partitioning protein